MNSNRLLRSEVPISQTWSLEDLFASPEVWEKERLELSILVDTVTQYRGQLGEGADRVLACLSAQEQVLVRLMHVSTYARLRLAEDGTDPVRQTEAAKAGDTTAKVNAELSFIRSELLALPEGTIERYLQEEPELAPFRKSLMDLLDTKPHQLSAETENVLASLGEVLGAPYTIYQRSKLSDMTFQPVVDVDGGSRPVSFALYEEKYESSPDTALRRNAYESFTKTLDSYKNTFAAVYAAEVKKQVILARLRGYESATHMQLESQQVGIETYRNVLDILFHELAPHMRRYARLKERMLGLERIRFCDLKAPLDAAYSPPATFESVGRIVQDALQVLGPEYSEFIRRAFTERWIDYADNVGKNTGAFCSTPYGNHSYVLMTWSDSARDAFLAAHELGHAGHFMLAGRYQRYTNCRSTLFFIEAPSTLNELLVAQHLQKQATDDRMRRWINLQLMQTYYHNFVTHLLEGEVQRRVFAAAEADEPLTARSLTEKKTQVLAAFWGDAVQLDAGAGLTWMRQPHYYMGLYPYTYAAGLSAATAVASMIREEGQPAVDRWLETLKAGGSLRPLELLKLAGVDMSEPAPIRSAATYVGRLVDELEAMFT